MVALWHCVVPFLRRIKLQEPVRIGEKFSTDVAVPISRYNGGPVSPILKQFVLTYASLEVVRTIVRVVAIQVWKVVRTIVRVVAILSSSV